MNQCSLLMCCAFCIGAHCGAGCHGGALLDAALDLLCGQRKPWLQSQLVFRVKGRLFWDSVCCRFGYRCCTVLCSLRLLVCVDFRFPAGTLQPVTKSQLCHKFHIEGVFSSLCVSRVVLQPLANDSFCKLGDDVTVTCSEFLDSQ